MALRVTDTYTGPTACDAAQIDTAFATNGTPIPGLGKLIASWAPRFGFRGEAVAGQISLETGWGTNYWTTQHNNIMSIGVTGEASSTPKTGPDWQQADTPTGPRWLRGYHFATVEAGLLAGLIHMATYIYGRDKGQWPAGALSYFNDTTSDPRLPALLKTAMPGTVKVFNDLGNGRYAAASGYGDGIVSRANLILGYPHAITKGLGIPSQSEDFYSWLTKNGVTVAKQYVDDGWIGRGGMQPEAIVHHVTDGYGVMSAINWWKNASVDGSTQQLVAGPDDPDYPDGTLVIARKDEDTAWANGVWGKPNLTIPTIYQWYTKNINPNRVTLSREHVGKPFDPKFPSDLQMRTSLFCDLQWIAKYPNILPDRNHFLRHSDIDAVNRANCPGPRFNLDALIAQVVAMAQNVTNPHYQSFLDMWEAIVSGKASVIDAWGSYWS